MAPPVVDPRVTGRVLGVFLAWFALAMLIPWGYGLVIGGADLGALLGAAVITGVTGFLLILTSGMRGGRELKPREGQLLVVLIWAAVTFFGALPFYFSPYFPSFTDALFESVSGFTTTGSTVLSDVEVLSKPIQLWRCLSHWLGGMGIVLLGVAILPLIGHGGMHLYRAEFSGAKSDKLKPRVAETALSLWKIYVALTLAEWLALQWAGMDGYEAVCHAFSTLGTGGFSTRTASIAAFHSPLIEYIVILFMLLSGISFIQHYRLWVEGRSLVYFTDFESRYYLAMVVAASLIIAAVLILDRDYAPEHALRNALFHVSAIITTTGFVTDDYVLWPPLPQMILFGLMFVGGCTGSTAGGLKTARILLLTRVVDREFRRMAEPHAVYKVRLGGRVIPEDTIQSLLNLVYLAFVVNFIAAMLLAALGVDVLTSIAAVAASMFNVGPGLAGVGPVENYGHLPDLAKWILCGCMIAGRLEYYSLLVIITSTFWRR
jgi:trk system potassium uptake protein TrkH